jgi:hypothetical protein
MASHDANVVELSPDALEVLVGRTSTGGGGGGAVSSVNSKTGAVVLTYTDVGASSSSHTHTAPVTSVNAKTGAVVLSYTDVGAASASHTHAATAVAWVDITGKPATFTPSAHSHTIADLPSGTTISAYYSGTAWPARPTARTDVTVLWIGGSSTTPPTAGLSGKDLWLRDIPLVGGP